MQPEWKLLESVVEDVIDGNAIDWAQASQSGVNEDENAAIQSLQVVASICHFDADRRNQVTAPLRMVESGPERWGELTLKEQLGRGSSADVFRVEDEKLRLELALKLPRREAMDETEQRQFLAEARALAKVNHPGVVRIYRVEEQDGRPGILMELVRGSAFDELVNRDGPMGENAVIDHGKAIAAALAAVHASGLIHRDVKAQNVMLAEGGRAVLMDLGCGIERAVASDHQGGWGLAGTPYYMAPEIMAGEKPTVRSDVYSLGVLLFYLASKDFPIHGNNWDQLRQNHGRPRETTLLDIRPDLSDEFVAVVEKTLHRDASQRHASAGHLVQALENLQRSKIAKDAVEGSLLQRLLENKTVRLAAVAALLALGAAAVGQLFAPAALDVELNLQRRSSASSERLVSGSSVSVGDMLVLDVESSRDAYVYVLSQDDLGVSSLLFPLPNGDFANPLAEGATHTLPGTVDGRAHGWIISSDAGRERILVIASAKRLPELEELLVALPAVGGASYAPVPSEALLRTRGILELGELPGEYGAGQEFDHLFEQAQGLARENRDLVIRSFELPNTSD